MGLRPGCETPGDLQAIHRLRRKNLCNLSMVCKFQFAQATLFIRQPAAVLISVKSILILSVSPEGRVTVAVALPFFTCGVVTVKFFSQPLSQSCAQINMSASMRLISLGALA